MRFTRYAAERERAAGYLAGVAQVRSCPRCVQADAAGCRRGDKTRRSSAACHDGTDWRIQLSPAVAGPGAVPVMEARLQCDPGGTEGALQRSGISRRVPRRGDQTAGTLYQYLESRER